MKKYIILGGVSLVSMGIGAGVSYLATKKVLEAKYETLLQEELTETKRFYNRLNKKEAPFSTPQTALAFYKEKVEDYSARLEMEQGMNDQEYMMEHHHIDMGEGGPIDGLQEDEVVEAPTNTDEPYVISKHDYEHTNPDYHKADFTYYETDDILIDHGTVPLDIDLVGAGNLEKFGHGSGHKDRVYVRNEELETDIEITRSDGDFSEEVLGYIEHSSGPRKVLKFHREEE